MAISVADNFSYQGTKPLDARLKFDTVADMKAAVEATLYDGCFSYVTATKKYYTYDSSNTSDATTGKWREYEGGGSGGASNLSDLGDVNVSSPADGEVLTYDSSSSMWVNSAGGSTTVAELGDIEDVDLTSLTDGQTIVWDATNSKWVNGTPSGGGGALYELSDVNLGLLSDGDVLKYNATDDEWENGQPDISADLTDLGDVALVTPTNGQLLRYNATTSKWENSDDSDSIVNGYAYETVVGNPMEFITAANAMTSHDAVTVSNQSIFTGKAGSAFMLYYGRIRAYLLYSAYPFDIKAQTVKQSGNWWASLSRQTSDSSSHPGFTSQDAFLYTTGITSISNVTIAASWEHDRVLYNDDLEGEFYVTKNVGISDSGNTYKDKTYVVDGIKFYSDSAHTTLITPETGKIYIDLTTNTQYRWDGHEYQEIGGGGGTSYTAGDGIDITNGVISTDNMQSGDMADVVSPLPSPSGGGEILTETLSAGSTTVTFTGIPTSGNNLINFYTSANINYTAINTATSGQVTLTFESQASAVTVYCEIRSMSS